MPDYTPSPARHVGDGCHCPDYITYCVHVDADVYWILTPADSKREFVRRTGTLNLRGGDPCPACKRPVGRPGGEKVPFFVFGPGTPSTPLCVCAVEINLRTSGGIRKAQSLEEAFALVYGGDA